MRTRSSSGLADIQTPRAGGIAVILAMLAANQYLTSGVGNFKVYRVTWDATTAGRQL